MELTVYTKLIKRLSDLDLGLEVKVGVGKLLAFTECALCAGRLLAHFFISAAMATGVEFDSAHASQIAPGEDADDVPIILKRETFDKKSPTGL
jgi:hypothetical protein